MKRNINNGSDSLQCENIHCAFVHPFRCVKLYNCWSNWIKLIPFRYRCCTYARPGFGLHFACESLFFTYMVYLTLIPTLISNHIYHEVWDEITYTFPNFNGISLEWISNVITHFIAHVLTYLSMLGLQVIHASKRGSMVSYYVVMLSYPWT